METAKLRRVIKKLPARQALTDEYEGSTDTRAVWYSTQKEHLVGWLQEYGGPGAYGRSQPGRDAKFFYNHFRCAAGLVWLAEALGEDPVRIAAGITAIRGAGIDVGSQAAAFRRTVPWSRIEELVNQQTEPSLVSRVSSQFRRGR